MVLDQTVSLHTCFWRKERPLVFNHTQSRVDLWICGSPCTQYAVCVEILHQLAKLLTGFDPRLTEHKLTQFTHRGTAVHARGTAVIILSSDKPAQL